MSANVIWSGSLTKYLDPSYPQIKCAYQKKTSVLVYRGPYAVLAAAQPVYGARSPAEAAGMMVTESELKKEPGRKGVLTVNCVLGMDTVEWDVTPPRPKPDCKFIRIDRAVELNKKYAQLFQNMDQGDALLGQIQAALQASTPQERVNAVGKFKNNALAYDLYFKKRKGEDQFMDFYPHATLIVYSPFPPTIISKGGFIQQPSSVIPVPTGYTWIRMGDELSKPNQWWETTYQWIGGVSIDRTLYGG